MALESLIIFLVIGALAGWLAGVVVRGYGFGPGGNVLVGVVGSLVGGWLFGHFRLVHGNFVLADILGATTGAIILLFLIRLIRRRTLVERLFHR